MDRVIHQNPLLFEMPLLMADTIHSGGLTLFHAELLGVLKQGRGLK